MEEAYLLPSLEEGTRAVATAASQQSNVEVASAGVIPCLGWCGVRSTQFGGLL